MREKFNEKNLKEKNLNFISGNFERQERIPR